MPKVPTQDDVARAAGVSRTTVSYVLNEQPHISIPLETRQRVWAAMDQLGYVPNRAAQSLRTQKTLTIASIFEDITNPFHAAFESGIQEVTEHHGYDLVIYSTNGRADRERHVLTTLQQQGRVDGVIGSFYFAGLEDFLPLLARGVPVARVNGPDNPYQSVDYPIDTLVIDNIAAAREAVAHLLERGHRVIGMLAGEGPPRVDRAAGYQQALEADEVAFDPSLLEEGPFTVETGRTGMAKLLERHPRLTAVFAASDMLAMGAMLTLNRRGLKIPEDVAVVGFDDIFAAELVTPPLTTVAQFQDRLGRRAAEMLMERLRGEASSGSRYEVMPYQLIVRAST